MKPQGKGRGIKKNKKDRIKDRSREGTEHRELTEHGEGGA